MLEIYSEDNDIHDFVIIDCPPSLEHVLTIKCKMNNGRFCFSSYPMNIYALEWIKPINYTVELAVSRLNPDLENRLVFTMYDARTNLSLQVVENVNDNLQQIFIKQLY